MEAIGSDTVRGIVLYSGTETILFSDTLMAVPHHVLIHTQLS
jgi:hypothetical protein